MPTLVPLNNQFSSLADDAYVAIKQKIFSFEMLPGDLISEGNLVRLMQVSRTPLRQALQRLQYEGFLTAIPKIGWQIAPLDFNKLDELYDFRILIESHAIKVLCDKACSHEPLNDLAKIWLCNPLDRIQDGEQVGLLTTTNENVAVEVPEVFVAVIVIERDANVPVGVPEISPVDVLKLKPTAVNAVESAEGIEYEAAGPPLFEIV
jgi:hypothetical protein